jgi:hypothetical protein
MKQRILDNLEQAITALANAENIIHPSRGLYKDIHQHRLDLQSFRSDIEDGMYEKGATDNPSL